MVVNKNKEIIDEISIKIPSKSHYVKLARLTTSAICSDMGFDIEAIDDIKVAVAEACTNVVKHSKYDYFEMVFDVYDKKLKIIIKDKGIGFDAKNVKKPDLANPRESGLGLFIIQSLMDEVEVESNSSGSKISMIKYLGDDIVWET